MNRCLKTIFFLFLIGNASGFYDNYTCNYCGQLVYGVVLPNDVETLISVTEMYFQVGEGVVRRKNKVLKIP